MVSHIFIRLSSQESFYAFSQWKHSIFPATLQTDSLSRETTSIACICFKSTSKKSFTHFEMLSVNIFGWELSTIVVEGSLFYVVDENLYKLFGYVNKKSRVGYLKELCLSKSQSYPFILRESGEVQPSTGNVRKSACKLMSGEKYILTADMFSSMLIEKQSQGDARLRSIACPNLFVEELSNLIRAPANYSDGVYQELSVSCAKYSQPPSQPTSQPATLQSTPSPTPSLLNSFMPIPKPVSRKRKTPIECSCKGLFKRQRIVSDNTSARSKRRRVLASKRLFSKLREHLPPHISLGKVEFDVKGWWWECACCPRYDPGSRSTTTPWSHSETHFNNAWVYSSKFQCSHLFCNCFHIRYLQPEGNYLLSICHFISNSYQF